MHFNFLADQLLSDLATMIQMIQKITITLFHMTSDVEKGKYTKFSVLIIQLRQIKTALKLSFSFVQGFLLIRGALDLSETEV